MNPLALLKNSSRAFEYDVRDYGHMHCWATKRGPFRHGVQMIAKSRGRPSRVKRAKAVMLLRDWAKSTRTPKFRMNYTRYYLRQAFVVVERNDD